MHDVCVAVKEKNENAALVVHRGTRELGIAEEYFLSEQDRKQSGLSYESVYLLTMRFGDHGTNGEEPESYILEEMDKADIHNSEYNPATYIKEVEEAEARYEQLMDAAISDYVDGFLERKASKMKFRGRKQSQIWVPGDA